MDKIKKAVFGVILALCFVRPSAERRIFRAVLHDPTPGMDVPSVKGDVRAALAIEIMRLYLSRPVFFMLAGVVSPIALIGSFFW